MLRSLTLSLAFIASFCTVMAAADIEPRTVVITWRSGSPSFLSWQAAGKRGPISDLTPIIGSHSTAPYILDATLTAVERARALRNSTVIRQEPDRTITRIMVVKYEADADPQYVARKLLSLPDVQVAEPLSRHHLLEMPNDPSVGLQYHLPLIKAIDAWDVLPPNKTIVVGIVDTGIDTAHVDLGANVWRNSGEMGLDANQQDKRYNNLDDDGNGFADDWYGWDFLGADGTPDNEPLPGNPHGTHVGGIVAAIINNAIGVAGVGKNIRVMPVKIGYDDQFSSTVGRSADGILYAASMGASIINCSFGSGSPSFADVTVIEEATTLGSLIVAAAGNDGVNMAFYPAAYPQVLSVTATDERDELTYFSNLHSSVDVCAPGLTIYSTVPGDRYDYLNGTSMASPVAAAVAAMVRLRFPDYSPDETRAVVMSTCDNIDSLNRIFMGLYGIGRVNALKAVSESTPRWVSVINSTFTDADGDGFFEPNERLRLSLDIRNELEPLSQCVVHVTPAPAAFQPEIITDSIVVGPLAHGQTVTLAEDLLIDLPSDIPFNGELRLMVTITDSSQFVSRQMITAVVNPTYRTIDVNYLATTVNSMGNIGYNDYPSNIQGVGLSYKGGQSLLFEGALMVGVQPRDLPNVARGAQTDIKDTSFHPLRIAEIRTDSIPNGSRIVTSYSDVYDPWSIGLSITQNVYAMTADSLKRTLLITLDVANRVDTVIRDLFVSQFYDFDIGPSGSNNGCAWDRTRGIGLIQNTTRPDLPSVGVAMISPLPMNFFALDNDGDVSSPSIYDHFLRAEKWMTMSGGIRRANSRITDVSTIIGAGPFSLAPGESKQVCFVIAVGEDYTMLSKDIASARAAAELMGLNAAPYREIPMEDKITYIEGSPLLGPGSHAISFAVGQASPVTIDVIDLFGNPITTVVDNESFQVGTHTRTMNLPNIAQGTYFLRMTTFTSSVIEGFGVVR